MDAFLKAAIEEAEKGLAEGGIPIGSVLARHGRIIGRGHNRRAQKGSVTLHGEMDALENAGRLPLRLPGVDDLHDPVAVFDVQRGDLALRYPASRYRRE